MNKITIKDIAKHLGLSTSTVSRALSGHPDISSETTQKIKEIADQFHYKKNIYASLFRHNKSGLIALILPEINMFYSPNIIKSISKIITPSNYSLIIAVTNNDSETEIEIVEKCLKWSVEGVIISLSKETQSIDFLEPLKKQNIPCVMIDKTKEVTDFTTITIDNQKAAYDGVCHLIEYGHKNILGIFSSLKYNISSERLIGFNQALKQYKITSENSNFISVENSEELELNLIIHLQSGNYTGIFVMSDELLAKCIYIINKVGLKIKHDISLVAISDGIYPYLIEPNITHIKDSGNRLGKYAAKVIIDLINKPDITHFSRHLLDTKLVELYSVARI